MSFPFISWALSAVVNGGGTKTNGLAHVPHPLFFTSRFCERCKNISPFFGPSPSSHGICSVFAAFLKKLLSLIPKLRGFSIY
ncbi:hypothetical protein F4818DRAFT_400515 [Hypoxylon cercidicola]|nr:hypothetical protein F4818DRAFT_400515 [Hypoxylon cercidicola]